MSSWVSALPESLCDGGTGGGAVAACVLFFLEEVRESRLPLACSATGEDDCDCGGLLLRTAYWISESSENKTTVLTLGLSFIRKVVKLRGSR